jgi:hypothetical protein
MSLDVTLLLCPFTIALNIFTLKDTTKTHCNNVGLNVLNTAPLAVYLAEHWLVMGFKIDNSHVDAWVLKMEVAIKNIAFLMVASNLTVN